MTRKQSVGWVLVLLFFWQSFAAAQAPLPIEYFTRSDELGTMKLSPDGTFLAMTTGQHGAEFLTFFDLVQRKAVASVRAPDGLEINEFDWASNTRVIFMIAERQPGNVQPTPTGEIFAVDRDGGKQLRIYGYRAGQGSTGTHIKGREASYASPSIVSLLDGDDRHILIAEMPWKLAGDYWRFNPDAKPQLTRLDIYTGRESRVGRVPLAAATVIVDRDEQPRFALGADDTSMLAVAWKREPNAEWEAFQLPGFRKSTVIPRRFTADNRSVLFTGVPDGERFASLFELQLADRSVKKLISIPEADVLGIVTDFEDRDTIGVAGYTDKLVHHWIAPSHPAAKLRQALQKAFEGNEVSFVSRSDDGKRAIVFVQSDVAPGEFLLFDTQSRQAEMLKAARSWVDLNKMRPKAPIKLTARDGVQLHGYVTRPIGPGPHPLVVLPHGGPHYVRDEWSFDWEPQLLVSRGYAVLQVNFRGSDGYGVDFEEMGFRQWGARMQDDVTDATRWAIEREIAAPDRICIFGGSYGGYAALMGVVREPALYRCAIGFAGVYDLQLMYDTADIPDSKLGLNYLNRTLGTDAAELRARSPVHHADKIQVPVLLIHGKEDWRVDYTQAKRMKAALEQNRKPVEWLALRGEGHGIYDDETRLEVYTGILKFLDKHLAAQPVTKQ